MLRLLPYLSLTIAYVISGVLGLLLAVPPGYATAIFLPAGIAVGAMLIAGRATLPWTFIGSFLLNAWTAYSLDHHLQPIEVAVATVIAGASTLQAALGGFMLRRAIGYPTALDNGRDLSRFLLLAPLCCLASATLSLSGMTALGVVPPGELVTSWITWWIGDTLGVLLVLPLLLIAVGEPRMQWRSRARTVGLPILIFFALFVAIFVRVSAWESDQSLLEFRLLSQQMADRIQAGFREQELFLQQLERSFDGRTTITRENFRRLVLPLPKWLSTIQAVEWAPRVELAERARFEAAQRSQTPGFFISERDASGSERPAANRAVYYPVTYVEPLSGNAEAQGFDLASEPDRNAAIRASLGSGTVSATAPLRLVQEQGEQSGMLLMDAVRTGADGPGIVLTVLRMGAFIDGLLAGTANELSLQLIDRDRGVALIGNWSVAPGAASDEQAFDFGTRHYLLRTIPTGAYWASHRAWQSWAVLVAGVFSTGLLGALLLLGTGQTHTFERLVEKRTRDLQSANQRLKVEIDERAHAEAALRQAQRMEAIGQLTGGVAHDFNNLLMVVSSNAELLHHHDLDDRALRRVAAIRRAAERGERLTRQLLSFSRQQMLRPERLDLRQLVQDSQDMLSRSLREDIEVVIDMGEDLRPVAVDRAELELALLNIGVNARDAMPNGGTLRLTARNVSCHGEENAAQTGLHGDFVALTVSDTGTGMTPEVVAHAFEPFFTTKDVGRGSGLGLSQVYGFAKQSDGTALLDSELGKGTSVTIFLPVASETADIAGIADDDGDGSDPLPPLRVLLVEDDDAVAGATKDLLRELGCEVLQAADGRSALAAVENDPALGLVISDLIMPGELSGADLARTLRHRRPDLPVLLATAYSEYGPPMAAEGFVLLEKPYHLRALANAIAAAIAEPGRVRARLTDDFDSEAASLG